MSKAPKLRFKEFSGDWEKKKLGKITKLTDGVHFTPTYVESGVPFWSVETVVSNAKPKYITEEAHKEAIKRCYPQVDDILLTRIGTLAKPKLIDWNEEFSIYVSLALIKASTNYNSKFARYYFETEYYQKDFLSKSLLTATPKKINMEDLKQTNIKLPSIEEQEKIASFFSLIDDKISLQGEKVEALKDYKKGMMQKIFSRELRFKDDEGRDYPEWEEKKLGEIANITMGQSPSSACYNEEYIGLPLIQGNADVKDRKTEPRVYTSEITKTCDIGDIIMSVRAPVGAISMSLHNACIGRGVCSIKPRYNVEYVYQFLLKYESKWSQVSQGSTFESVNSNDIKSLKILFPNLDEQNKIGNFLKNIDKRIEKEQEKLDSLNEYKKGLLQQMFV